MNKKIMCKFGSIFLLVILAGCSTPKTFITNSQPKTYEVQTKHTVFFEQSIDATWNDLLTIFATSEYKIESINMNAHMVTLRYIGKPGLYIDCGTKRINTEGNEVAIINSKRLYSYRAYQYIHLETYSVTNNFTGYVNLLVTGNDISSKVLAQFDLELDTEVKRTTTRGRSFSSNQKEKLKLNSFKPTRSELFKTNCRSTGELERQVYKIISLMHVASSN